MLPRVAAQYLRCPAEAHAEEVLHRLPLLLPHIVELLLPLYRLVHRAKADGHYVVDGVYVKYEVHSIDQLKHKVLYSVKVLVSVIKYLVVAGPVDYVHPVEPLRELIEYPEDVLRCPVPIFLVGMVHIIIVEHFSVLSL
jgi:hypothetical protein